MPEKVPISVIIPTWRRPAKLKQCLENILACDPQPSQILVHIDAGDQETENMLNNCFGGIASWHVSRTPKGPGGGRNWLIEHAQYPYLAGFDDDSWPLDLDFFALALKLIEKYPSAAVITLHELRPGKNEEKTCRECRPVASFQNCGSLFRKAAFQHIQGFVPLRHAYGMEEADVALQLMDAGWDIIRCDDLKFFHDSTLSHQASKEINAAHITNTALLAFLRYPILYWPLGLFQTLNRVKYAITQRRYEGIASGLLHIPVACYRKRHYRKTVSCQTLRFARRIARCGDK